MTTCSSTADAARARSRLAWLCVRVVVALVALVVSGGIPASILLRPVVLERSVPPVPRDAPRDAVVLASVTAEGHAIEGATVRVYSLRADAAGTRAYAAGEAKTARGGHARLERVPSGETWIVAEAEGRARASANLVLAAGERAVDLALGVEHRLDVEVRDDRDAPVAQAEVEIAQADPLPIGARAGPNGVAHATRLGAPPWSVTARAPGYEDVSVRGVREGDALRVVLRKLGAIAVTVEDAAGNPAPHARVQIASPALWPARVADADASGGVRIGALAAGTYALRATSGDRASPIELGVSLARGEAKSVTLRLAPGETLSALVTGDDGAPVGGARVTLAESGVSPFPIEATTDREGRARLGPIARGPASLAVRAEGFVPRGAIAIADPAPSEVAVVLARAGSIEGRVVDTRGFPIAGATVEIVGTAFDGAPIDDDPRRARFTDAQFASALGGPRPLLAAGELGVVPGPVPPIPAAGALVPGAPPSVVTDEPWVTRADGTYRASPASPGRVRALVHHPQYVDATSDLVSLAPGGTARIDVVLREGGMLEGRVLDATGRGIDGARVVLAAMHGTLERVARTATDGSFGFAAVPGEVVLYASPDDDGSPPEARAVVQVPDGGRATVTLQLPVKRDPLPVRVRDDRGYPVDDAQITVASLDPGSALRETVFTDPRGEAAIANARGLALRAEVTAPGRAPSVGRVEGSAESFDVTLAAAEHVAGRVRSTRGESIANAEVTLYAASGARHARTDADGDFSIAELAHGPARLVVRADGFAQASRAIAVDANGGVRPTSLDVIELARGGIVEGVVLDARGDPVVGARVAQGVVPTYLAVGGTPAGVSVTNARGLFRLADLPEGDVTIEAFAPDTGRARVTARVAAGETTRDVRLSLALDPDDSKSHEPAAAGSLAVTLGERSDPREVIVVTVAEGSEAERAGIAPDDVITSVNGMAVESMEVARARMSGPLGDDVVLGVRRASGAETIRVPREPVRR